MLQEFKALEDNHTWDIIPLLPTKKATPCKWVCKIKQRSDGIVERYKTRLFIRGDTQKEGIDYENHAWDIVPFLSTNVCCFLLPRMLGLCFSWMLIIFFYMGIVMRMSI